MIFCTTLSTDLNAKPIFIYVAVAVFILVLLAIPITISIITVKKRQKKKRMELLNYEVAQKAEKEARNAEQLAAAVTAAVAAYLSAEAKKKGGQAPDFRVVAFRRSGGAQPWNRR